MKFGIKRTILAILLETGSQCRYAVTNTNLH